MTGPRGPQGPAGPIGPVGRTGATGPQGPADGHGLQAPVSLTVQCIDDTAIHPQPVTLRAAPTWWVAKITTG